MLQNVTQIEKYYIENIIFRNELKSSDLHFKKLVFATTCLF